MLYLLDTANIEHIKRALDYYPIAGITTNPTILSKEKKEPIEHLKTIRKIIGKDLTLHAQTLGSTAEDIIREAHYIKENIDDEVYIKIPVMAEGIKAIKKLKAEGFNVTATAIITPSQALMAAVAGADYLAPYVNRIDNISGNGVQVVEDILKGINHYNLPSKVVAASFKNIQQVHEVAKRGVHAITIAADLMDKLLEHPLTDWSIEQFGKDWEEAYGRKGLYDIK